MAKRRCVDLDAQKIYEVLLDMNYKAVNARYSHDEHVAPSAMPVGEWLRTYERKPWQMLKTMECYLYQCAEGEIPHSNLYKLIQTATNQYMKHLIGQIEDYANADWA